MTKTGDKLVFVSEYFWPDEASTGKLVGDLVDQLRQDDPDLRITVLTSDRLYRSAKAYSLPRTEFHNGVQIERFRSRRSGQGDRVLRRSWSDLVFALQTSRRLLQMGVDCVFVGTNPPFMPLLVSLVAWLKKKPLVYLIHDLYPDMPVAQGMWSENMAVGILRRWQKWALSKATRILVPGRCMRQYLVRHYGVMPEAVEVVPNWYTSHLASVEEGQVKGIDDAELHVVYGGNLGLAQEFNTLIDAAELLRDTPRIRFFLVGEGAVKADLQRMVAERGLTNVTFKDFLPHQELDQLMRPPSLGVVSLSLAMQGLAVPSKTYNILASGTPILGIIGRDTEVGLVVEEAQCGVVVNPGEAAQLAEALCSLVDHPERLASMARGAVDYAREYASLGSSAAKYLRVLKECLRTNV